MCCQQWFREIFLLTKKNYKLLFRNWKTTTVLLVSPFLFTCLLMILQFGLRDEAGVFGQVFREFAPTNPPSIPKCFPNRVTGQCIAIAYAPDTDADLVTIVNEIATENGVTQRGFESADVLNSYLLANPNTTQGAYLFHAPFSSLNVNYSVQWNFTQFCRNVYCTNPQSNVLYPMQYHMNKKIWRQRFGAVASYVISLIQYPRAELFRVDVIVGAGTFFYFLSFMFIFIVTLGSIALEKETRLREIMQLSGLRDAPFWISWFLQTIAINVMASIVLSISGLMFQLSFFLKNDFRTYFVLFILFGMSLSIMCFFVSTLVWKAKSATPLGFVLFIIFYFFASVAGNIYPIVSEEWRQLFGLFPPILFVKGLADLATASSSDLSNGISWSQIGTYTDIWPLQKIYQWLFLDGFIFAVLLWYFDNVLPTESGSRRPIYFFLTPSYWLGRNVCKRRHRRVEEREKDGIPLSDKFIEDEDVHALRMKLTNEGSSDQVDEKNEENDAIRIQNLVKSYNGKAFAVRRLYLNVRPNTLFCLLGENGAGKSTTISMLTGILPPSTGLVRIQGLDLYDEMNEIRKITGVCPQFDILWDALTAYEHVELFAGLRGVPPEGVEDEARTRLEEVGLWNEKDQLSSTFSGGMKRRLSVAIAMIGNPKIVYLDEPTTGMDPIMRRGVWDMIEKAKKDRTIVLTTHAMEEADILGDVIGIMAKGRLRCIGSSVRLKNKFGAGYELVLHVDRMKIPLAQQLVHSVLPEAIFVSEMSGFLTYSIPRYHTNQLPGAFAQLEQLSQQHGIIDFSVSPSTLEDVFLSITHQAQTENELGQVVASFPQIQQPVEKGSQDISGGEGYQLSSTSRVSSNPNGQATPTQVLPAPERLQ